MTINAGEGAFAFAGVVVLTMLASHSFDPRLIWDSAAKNQRQSFLRRPEAT
jgi:paraquat-inducible protein A